MSRVRRFVKKSRKQIRAVFYGVFIAGFTTVLFVDLTKGTVTTEFVIKWAMGLAVVVLFVEYCILFATYCRNKIETAGSQFALMQSLEPLWERLGRAQKIDLLGGTYKTFTDRAENLSALSKGIKSGCEVRILMLHPEGDGMADVVRSRNELGRILRDGLISEEIKNSIGRLLEVVGLETTLKILKLYNSAPRFSFYRIDSEYLVTIYTFGRGASSPAMYLDAKHGHNEICRSFDRGFRELWEAPSTIAVTKDLLRQFQLLD